MIKLKLKGPFYKRCIGCTEPMTGVYSHEIRDVCTPCGGSAKSSYDDIELDRERERKFREAKVKRLAERETRLAELRHRARMKHIGKKPG